MKDAADNATPELLDVDDNAPLFVVRAIELKLLRRTGAGAMALYLAVLKPHANGAGQVEGLTYASIAAKLTPEGNRRGGRQPVPVTAQVLRGYLDRLEAAGLIWRDPERARKSGELQVYLTVSR